MKSLAIIFVLVVALGFESVYGGKVRGVAPERASLYDETKQFKCLDGSAVISFSHVNDDYCDCRDGSDEPGTAACLNGVFACENLGYVVQFVPSSRVNDGICDCCDGSDEYDGKTTCENTCGALAAKMREEEEKLKRLKEEGYAKRKEFIDLAAQLKKSLQDQAQELETKKAELLNERNLLEERKNLLEVRAKEAKDKQDLIAQEKQKELDLINLAKKAKELFDLLDANKDTLVTPDELVKYQELDVIFNNDGSFTIEEAQQLLDENTGIEYTIFESVYYPKISSYIKLESDVSTDHNQQQTEVLEESHEHDHEHDHENDHEHDHEHDHDHDHEHIPSTPPATSSPQYDAETQALIDEAAAARRLYDDADVTYRGVESQLADIKHKLEADTGPHGEYATMIDQCYEYEDREYIYKLCPFERTVQKSKASSGETSIGVWKSWGDESADDVMAKYRVMRFENGLACWNGPQRSTKVFVSCGLENKITSVTEPNRCEYEMKFETPVVCDAPTNQSTEHIHDDL